MTDLNDLKEPSLIRFHFFNRQEMKNITTNEKDEKKFSNFRHVKDMLVFGLGYYRNKSV